MAPKSQADLNQDRDDAAAHARTAETAAKQAAVDSDKADADAGEAESLLDDANLELRSANREYARAERGVSSETREEAIEAARAAKTEVDDGQSAPVFSDAEAKAAGEAFDQQVKSARARLDAAAKRRSEAQIKQKNAFANAAMRRKAALAADKANQIALKKRWAAQRDAVIANELSLQGTKKKVRWLAWDGTLGVGTCNTLPADPASAAAIARADYQARKATINLPNSSGVETKSAALQTPSTVSVRIASCTALPFMPVRDARATVQVQLKRMHRIRSLMFRVLDAHGTAVYQEVLGAAQIDALHEIEADAARYPELVAAAVGADPVVYAHEERQRRLRSMPAAGFARPADGPFQFRVWVSSTPNAFAGAAIAHQPLEIYGKKVHDQSVRPAAKPGQTAGDYATKKDKVERNAVGTNRVQVKKARLVHFAGHAVLSKHISPGASQTYAAKIADLQASLQAANTWFGPRRPNEQRILIGPEWFFQTAAYPHAHTSAEKTQIVQDLIALSNGVDAQGWLLFPGTILYGEPIATSGALAVFNLMPILENGLQVHEYYKRQWGSDTEKCATSKGLPTDPPWFSVGFEVPANGNEKRASKLDKGQFPASLIAPMKQHWQTTSKPATKIVEGGVKPRWQVTSDDERFAVWKPSPKVLRLCRRELFATAIEDDATWNTWIGAALVRASYIKSNFFTHNGLKLALEICADHNGARACGEYQAVDGSGAGATDGVDIHIITAVGVPPNAWKSVARKNGLYAHLDGDTGVAFTRLVTERRTPITTVGATARASWVTRQNGAFLSIAKPVVGPGLQPVDFSDPKERMIDDVANASLKFSSYMLEEL